MSFMLSRSDHVMSSMPTHLLALSKALLFVCSSAFLLILAGCDEAGDFRPDAVGPDAEIAVVVDSNIWKGPVGNALQTELAPYLATLPAPERAYELRQVQLNQNTLERVKTQKNVLFVAPLTDTSNVGDFIRGRLPEGGIEAVEGGGRIVASRPNLWRRNQKVYFIAASDTSTLVETINSYGPALRDSFDVATRQRVAREMYRRQRQHNLEEQLMEDQGFAVNVQHDFVIAMDTTNFVWLRRILSDTWRSFFVHYVEDGDPSMLSPEWMVATRDSLTRQYVQGNLGDWVEVDRRRPLEIEETDFNGRYGYEMRGLWQMVGEDEAGNRYQAGMGGPFISYGFYDQAQNRVYFIDGMVFAPGYEKREFLRQMEVMAHTFRTAEEARGGGTQVATR